MSTEHQQYSTANQQDVIRDYAQRRGFEIVRTFADEGKSGLGITERDALRQLIEDAQSGEVDFEAILVYAVSRWGRFQDADESAYYEYLCKRAGIEVHYLKQYGTAPAFRHIRPDFVQFLYYPVQSLSDGIFICHLSSTS